MKPVWKKDAFEYIKAAASDPSLLSSVGDNPFINSMEKELEELLRLPEHRAVAVSSATDGMVAVLRSLGIGRGDEVIVPAFSWGQSLNPILEVGATPVFVDIEKGGVNLDLSSVESVRTQRTRAILAAELFGIPLDWRRLDEISGGLFTIVDAAQSFGAVHEGAWPTAVVFSFGRGKLICGGEGGAVIAKSKNLYDAILLSSQHPIRVLQNTLTNLPFELADSVAPNARIHPFAAALITSELKSFRKQYHQYRKRILTTREKLKEEGFTPVPVPSSAFQAPPVIPVLTDQGESLLDFCKTDRLEVKKCCQKPLVLLPTVKKQEYLPGLGYLGKKVRRIKVRHTNLEYPQSIECAEKLYLVTP